MMFQNDGLEHVLFVMDLYKFYSVIAQSFCLKCSMAQTLLLHK